MGYFHNLHLFTGSPERTIPDKDNPEVIYFGPGIHTVKNGELRVPSGKTVYLAGGAVLMGRVLIENVHDDKIARKRNYRSFYKRRYSYCEFPRCLCRRNCCYSMCDRRSEMLLSVMSKY